MTETVRAYVGRLFSLVLPLAAYTGEVATRALAAVRAPGGSYRKETRP